MQFKKKSEIMKIAYFISIYNFEVNTEGKFLCSSYYNQMYSLKKKLCWSEPNLRSLMWVYSTTFSGIVIFLTKLKSMF